MAKQKRRQLERKWRQSRLTIHLDVFKEQKRHVNKLISSAKSSYYTAKIIEAASDQKQLYNVVITMLLKPEASLPDGRSVEQLASEFELFFQAKVKQIQENLVSDADYVPPDECPCAVGAKLDIFLVSDADYVSPDEWPCTVAAKLHIFLPATEDEVTLLVAKSPSKSCSLDPVPTWMLKPHLDCILPSITNIVNESMSTGIIVPTKMKAALVTTLLKKPYLDKNVMENFRPV